MNRWFITVSKNNDSVIFNLKYHPTRETASDLSCNAWQHVVLYSWLIQTRLMNFDSLSPYAHQCDDSGIYTISDNPLKIFKSVEVYFLQSLCQKKKTSLFSWNVHQGYYYPCHFPPMFMLLFCLIEFYETKLIFFFITKITFVLQKYDFMITSIP